jgi:hypothetical protein
VALDGAGIWHDLGEHFEQISSDLGSAQFLDWLKNSASHVMRLGNRTELETGNFEATLESLYEQHVCTPEVQGPAFSTSCCARPVRRSKFENLLLPRSRAPNKPASLHSPWVYIGVAASVIGIVLPWGAERVIPSAPIVSETPYEPIALPLAYESRNSLSYLAWIWVIRRHSYMLGQKLETRAECDC